MALSPGDLGGEGLHRVNKNTMKLITSNQDKLKEFQRIIPEINS